MLFFVLTRELVVLSNELDVVFEVLDTEDLVVDLVTGAEIINAAKSGLVFGNVRCVSDGAMWVVLMFKGFSGDELNSRDWACSDGRIYFRGKFLKVYAQVDTMCMSYAGKEWELFHVKNDGVAYLYMLLGWEIVARYVQYIEELDTFLIHYVASDSGKSVYFEVMVSKSCEPLAVFEGYVGGLECFDADVCSDRVLTYCARETLLRGEGWWSYLMRAEG